MTAFDAILGTYSQKVGKELETLCDKKIQESASIGPANKHYFQQLKEFIMRGGKRLRPIAFIMACKALDPNASLDEVIKASTSVELLHNGTLSHDDVMDEDSLRRGGPSTWAVFKDYHAKRWGERGAQRYGESMAIMQGNSFTTLAFQQLLDRKLDASKKLSALAHFNHYYDVVNNGQVFDITLQKMGNATETDYLKMVNMKTGALFEGAIVIGAALGGATTLQMDAFKSYASKMGVAFQMQDDVLGVFGSQEKFGKPTDSDIKEGKRTLMVIHALQKAGPEDRKTLEKTLGNRSATPTDIEAVRKILIKTGAVEHCKQQAKDLAEACKRDIKKIKIDPESLDFFTGLADYVRNRDI